MEKHNSKVSYWLEIAEYDLVTAQAMLETKRFLYVGFMCHQTIEKLLKAYYVSVLEDTPPYIHNLSRLANLAGLFEQLSEEQKDLLDLLEPLNIQARYPTHKDLIFDSLSHEKCEQLISQTKELSEWIKNQL